ncbi:MAG: ribose-phosphate pyrophosphokinase-like domain-containing protein, partial [Candidatus Wallbacteria bacterium]|nr:ribose-phosphate pyrophosphokinase-like domain-containing protein [Candidatus Wallbacteria bacterium]
MLEADTRNFITQEEYYRLRETKLKGPNGWLLFFATQSGYPRAQRVVDMYNSLLYRTDSGKQAVLIHQRDDGTPIIKTHEDMETNPRLPTHVAGSNIFLFSDPHSRQSGIVVNDEIYRTMQLVYTLKVHGAGRVSVVMPYMAYSRAERTSYLKREAAQSELFGKLLLSSGVDSIITYHLHNDA